MPRNWRPTKEALERNGFELRDGRIQRITGERKPSPELSKLVDKMAAEMVAAKKARAKMKAKAKPKKRVTDVEGPILQPCLKFKDGRKGPQL